MVADGSSTTIRAGYLRCFVSEKHRKDTAEENVRQRWARSLVDEYGYDLADMEVEFSIKMGTSRKRADIVVFVHGEEHRQDRVQIVIEAKRDDVLPRDVSEGVEQLKSYMSACSSCRFGLWVGSERIALEKTADGKIVEVTDIPRFGEGRPRPPRFQDLVAATDLKAALRRCHNYIYGNQGLQKAEAFHELQKLIFCKVLDEKEAVDELQFYVHSEERRSIAGQSRLLDDRVSPLFAEVKTRYPYIFDPTDVVKLDLKVLAYIVSELQRYSLLHTKADIKGQAYEELVGANLRGDRGEYFTPRNVCDMAVEMVLSLFPERRLTSLKVFDSCCGTGGFLVSTINLLRKKISSVEYAKGGSGEEIRNRINLRVKELAERNLFGMDINPFLVRTAQMNLVMHGDGSANVFQGNSLVAPGEWNDLNARNQVKQGIFDIVLTNPPFGGSAEVDDPHILSRYELANFGISKIRSSLPAEQLFVEAAFKYVKPGGFLAIVLPDSILNNPSLEFIRRWLLENSRVVASIDLPKETFAEGRGVKNPSVLVVQRLTTSETRLARARAIEEYEIFMAIPEKVGRDQRGNPVYVRTLGGMIVLDNENRTMIDDDLPQVAEKFRAWLSKRI